MAQFRHLNPEEIWNIIESFQAGESKASIAKRHGIDHSTVIYHIEKYDHSYPEQGGVYAVIKLKQRKVCTHPSSRCTFCGRMRNEIEREERGRIRELSLKLEEANTRLARAGLSTV